MLNWEQQDNNMGFKTTMTDKLTKVFKSAVPAVGGAIGKSGKMLKNVPKVNIPKTKTPLPNPKQYKAPQTKPKAKETQQQKEAYMYSMNKKFKTK